MSACVKLHLIVAELYSCMRHVSSSFNLLHRPLSRLTTHTVSAVSDSTLLRLATAVQSTQTSCYGNAATYILLPSGADTNYQQRQAVLVYMLTTRIPSARCSRPSSRTECYISRTCATCTSVLHSIHTIAGHSTVHCCASVHESCEHDSSYMSISQCL
jgi:hypothetical protein